MSVAPAIRPACVRRLGRQPYEPVWRAMQRFTDARDAATPDELWVVEHEPVFTLGQAGKPEHVLMPGEIPVIHVDRGGQVTYHGPGQIVAYPVRDLKRLKVGVRDYVCKSEQAMIDTLDEWNIEAARKDVQHAYGQIARELVKGDGDDKRLAVDIVKLVQQMPLPLSKHEQRVELLKEAGRSRGKSGQEQSRQPGAEPERAIQPGRQSAQKPGQGQDTERS